MKQYTLITFDTGLYMVADEPREEKYYFSTYAGAVLFINLLYKWEREWAPVYNIGVGTETFSYALSSARYGSGEWECQLFGCGSTMTWRPTNENVPNKFWRTMQFLIFGNKWRKL